MTFCILGIMDTPILAAFSWDCDTTSGRREPSGEDGGMSRPNATTGQLKLIWLCQIS